MDSTTENKGVTSFTCKRKEFQDALKSVKNPFMRVLSVKTRFAENKILLNIDGNDYPVPCTENTGNDATFNASIDGMKRLCKNVKEESYQFFIYEDNVEMNLHHLYKSSYNGFSYYDFY